MLSRMELEIVEKIAKDLNHYQLLKVSPVASIDDIRNAFHREAYQFHPDRYFDSSDEEVLKYAKRIYTKLVLAYRTLTDSKKREEYDLEMDLNAAEKAMPEGDPEILNAQTGLQKRPAAISSAAAVRFFKMAQSAFASGDFNSAKLNIRLALNTDPQNAEFIHLEEKIKAVAKK